VRNGDAEARAVREGGERWREVLGKEVREVLGKGVRGGEGG
jgi:hypothetical protein